MAFWLVRDEPLSQDTTALLADVRVYDATLQQDPYLLWLGFDAKTDVEPMILGQKRYHHDWHTFYASTDVHQDVQRENFATLQGTFFTAEDQKVLSQLKADLSTDVRLAPYEKYRTELTHIYAQQTLLNARWQALLDQKGNQNKGLLLSPEGVMPNYSLMADIHRLYVSHLIFQQDVKALAQYTERLIAQDQHANSLIDKMILLAFISHNIELIHELNQTLGTQQTLSELSVSQMSMRFPFASETAMVQAIINRLYNQKGLFDLIENDEKKLIKYPVADFFAPLFLNKQKSLNLYVDYILPTLKISHLPDPAFKQALEQPHQFEGDGFSIKNYLGNKLIQIALPQWETYAVRPRLINQKIRLLNILAKDQHLEVTTLNKNSQGDVFYKTNRLLCIKTPNPFINEEEERKYGSCLKNK